MKRTILFFSILVSLSFTGEKQKSTLRWGMVGIKNDLVVDETEITVGEWMEYVSYEDPSKVKRYIETGSVSHKRISKTEKDYLKRNEINKKLLPDSTVSSIRGLNYLFRNNNNKTLIGYSGLNGRVLIPIDSIFYATNKDKVARDLLLPISGISYNQAVDFCKWRSKLDSLKARKIYGEEVENTQREFYVFSLPTKENFIKFNCNKDSLTGKGYSNFNYKNSIPKKNKPPYTYTGKDLIQPWFGLYQNDNKMFSKNKFSSLDHIQGNVAEMSNIEGICYGGSYLHYASMSYAGIKTTYERPEIWLGLRCVGKQLIFKN